MQTLLREAMVLTAAKLLALSDIAGTKWAILPSLSDAERSAARSVSFYAGYLARTSVLLPVVQEDEQFHLACLLCARVEPFARHGLNCPFGLSVLPDSCDGNASISARAN